MQQDSNTFMVVCVCVSGCHDAVQHVRDRHVTILFGTTPCHVVSVRWMTATLLLLWSLCITEVACATFFTRILVRA